jgi:hypothetical protein
MWANVLSMLTAGLLVACAGFGAASLKLGLSEAEVTALMGTPNARHNLAGGSTRLEFARGPQGRQTWMVDLNSSGRVQGWHQALEEPRLHAFQAQAPGRSVAELQRTLGRPAERRPAGLAGGQLWSYRFETNECLWFQVTVADEQLVRDAGFGTDPQCDDRRGNLR